MDVDFSKQAAKYLTSMDKPTKQRFLSSIMGLTEIPPTGDIKQLNGYKTVTYRLRVGKYRIVYRYYKDNNDKTALYVLDIDSRGGIYK